MIGELSRTEIENLLSNQIVGRLGCFKDEELYIVPISYAFDGDHIYCHSHEGKKLQIMRSNPKVCFQVDEMKDMANWKSVIAWGTFEELKEISARNKALRILLKRPLPITSSVTTHLGESWPFSADDEAELKEIPGIVFRISIKNISGKFEINSESPMLMFN